MFVENGYNKRLLKNWQQNTTIKKIIRATTKITPEIETAKI